MTQQELKAIMRGKARLARGLVNLLDYDAERMYTDVDNISVERLEETIRETKRTIQQLMDTTTDIEYCLCAVRRIKPDA
jgi:hypothetical protein